MVHTLIMTAVTALISSAVGAFVGSIITKVKTVREQGRQAQLDAAELKELLRQNILWTCRMAIYDDHFSIDEKLEAYKVYRDQGGNHKTKTYMDDQVGMDVDEYLEKHGL